MTADRTDEAAIRRLVADRTEAMRAGDAAGLCATYAAGAVVFNLAPPLVQPPDASRDVALMQTWFDEKGGRVWLDVQDLQVTTSGDLAMCTNLAGMGSPPDAPQQFRLWYRSTLGLRRAGDDWRIIHEHTSTPFHMDGTFRAAIDLEP